MVPEAAVKDKLERGFYDGEKHIFCLAEQGVGQQDQTILGLYVDYVLNSWEHKDKVERGDVYGSCNHPNYQYTAEADKKHFR